MARRLLASGRPIAAAALGVIAAAAVGLIATGRADAEPVEHAIEVATSRYAFRPAVIRVRQGDTLRLRFAASDVVHGFYLEGHDLDVTIPPLSREVLVKRGSSTMSAEEVVLVAARTGKFRYRCSKTCGAMHPFMVGELVVGPNRLFGGATGAAVGLLLAGLVWVRVGPARGRER